MIERLNEIAVAGLAYYAGDPRREFNGISQLNINYTRQQRQALIKVLIDVISDLPLIHEADGWTIDGNNINESERNIIKYYTLDLNAKTLRGSLTGFKLKNSDYPFINKWNPLVLYILATKHNLKYPEFNFRNNNAKHLLGKDLMDLLVKLDVRDLYKINKYCKYYVSKQHRIVKEERQESSSTNMEEVTDDDEDRIDYYSKGNQIIRKWSPYTLALSNEYTKEYKDTKIKLSKKFMYELVYSGLIGSRKDVNFDIR